MAYIQTNIESYKIHHFAGSDDFAAQVSCFGTTGKVVGTITFHRDPTNILPNSHDLRQGILLHMPLSTFTDAIATLRSEKPLFIFIYTDTGWGGIGTLGLEPVGEQEAV